ncbi:unnamed protein product [Paramecium octaurelia]|uniref:Uncharacterized protein n=1 Tax=Paramecium octaurelia TaxID=43137 RepID=A0A8S1WBV9_PAROT|nr:unnamed protein product [Paramecium octaurelia]
MFNLCILARHELQETCYLIFDFMNEEFLQNIKLIKKYLDIQEGDGLFDIGAILRFPLEHFQQFKRA